MNNNFHAAKEGFKRTFLLNSINSNGGNLSVTAKLLGMTNANLHLLINNLGIKNHIKNLVSNINQIPSTSIIKNPINLLQEAVHNFEKRYLKDSLIKNGGFVMRAARDIGVHRNSINNKILAYGLVSYIKETRQKRRGKLC